MVDTQSRDRSLHCNNGRLYKFIYVSLHNRVIDFGVFRLCEFCACQTRHLNEGMDYIGGISDDAIGCDYKKLIQVCGRGRDGYFVFHTEKK